MKLLLSLEDALYLGVHAFILKKQQSEVILRKTDNYFTVQKRDIEKTGGDLSLALWFSALKDYSRRLKADKSGFKRVSSQVIQEDFGVDRRKAWRYNTKLVELGLIRLDTARHGGRTWVGFKIL